MATIQKLILKDGTIRYRSSVRLKGTQEKSANFDDLETATIYGNYWERVLKEGRNFEARDTDVYRVKDVVTLKYANDKRILPSLRQKLEEIWEEPISSLTEERLGEVADRLLRIKVRRGGVNDNTGKWDLPAPMTILRQFAYLSSAINHAIGLGMNLSNRCATVIAHLRELDRRAKNDG